MKKASRPYVGITGFMTHKEVEDCLDVMPLDSRRQLMVGVLASSKTITGQANSLGNKFPRRENLHKIFLSDPDVFNCIHFATDFPDQLYDHLMLALEYGAGLVDGIQLNMVWPDAKTLSRIKTQYPRIKFILQVSPHLGGYQVMTPYQIAHNIRSIYRGLVDYAIVDFSRGLGKQMPLEDVQRYLRAINRENPELGLVVGGGLEPANLGELITPLAQEFPDLSIDAEGRLRDDSPAGGCLLLEKAFLYIDNAFDVLEPIIV